MTHRVVQDIGTVARISGVQNRRLIISIFGWWMVAALLLQSAASGQCTVGGTAVAPVPAASVIRSMPLLLENPARAAVDAAGNVLLTDPKAGKVVVVSPSGAVVGFKGGLLSPTAVAVTGAGTILLCEQGAGRVSLFDPAWNAVGALGALGAGNGEFQNPTAVAVDPNMAFGKIYVTDGSANVVKVFLPSGQYDFSFGSQGTGAGQFDFPAAVWVSFAGEVFVGDQNNDRVEVFDRSGAFLRCFARSGGMLGPTKKGTIQALTGDSSGRLYIADAFQGQVQVFDFFGAKLANIGAFGNGPAGQLLTPMGLAIDPNNRLFVTSYNTSRVEVFGLDAFSDPVQISADGQAPVLTISGPSGTATNQSPIPVTLSFSKPVVGFAAGSLSVDNATVAGFTGMGAQYACELTPSGQGLVSLSVAAGACKDANGNDNLAGTFGIVYDSVSPMATVAVVGSNPTASDVLTYTVEFSETVDTSFSAANISLTPGSLPATVTVSGADTSFAISITPDDPAANGQVGIQFQGALQDGAGNAWVPPSAPPFTVYNWTGFSVNLADMQAYAGDSLTLAVNASFGPITPVFQWLRETPDKALEPGPDAPAWNLSNPALTDQGTYWCAVAYDGSLYESTHAKVVLAEHLTLIQPPAGGTVLYGATHTFSVAVSGGFAPLHYEWTHNGVVLPGANDPSYAKSVTGPGDAGVYGVQISDGFTDTVSAQATLNVASKVPLAGVLSLVALVAAMALTGALRHRTRLGRS